MGRRRPRHRRHRADRRRRDRVAPIATAPIDAAALPEVDAAADVAPPPLDAGATLAPPPPRSVVDAGTGSAARPKPLVDAGAGLSLKALYARADATATLRARFADVAGLAEPTSTS